uniref:permease-like cell division protein FtsX n=1 Tax=Thaumasiovibrio occultus TaxID=1891184 RepID=UPI000B35B363|nr:permease-like cell division protein FtsX [Thaumasiovibrio occultus]
MATSWFRKQTNDASSAYRNMLRRPLGTFLTIAVIAFALSLPACFYLMAKNLLLVHDKLPASGQLSVYMEGVPSPERQAALEKAWLAMPEVDEVTYISPDEGMELFSSYHGMAEALPLLEENPLPGMFVIEPVSDYIEDVIQLAQQVSSIDGVDDVRLDSDWILRFAAVKNVIVTLAVAFSIIMLLVVLLVVGNALRLQVQQEKNRIQVMKLVGATDRDILRPYLYTGVWYGIIGSLVAWLMTAAMIFGISASVAELAAEYNAAFRIAGLNLDELSLFVMTAMLLGIFAALLSARRHLKEIEPV